MGRLLKIGLYSPFFGSTIGGGEKYLGVTAEALREAFPEHQVDIVSPVPVDRDLYERMLRLDFSGINLIATRKRVRRWQRFLNSVPTLRLYRDLVVSLQSSRFTKQYDLFFSMVYVLPAFSQARAGIILCQFPYPLGGTRSRLAERLAPVYWLYALPYRLGKRLLLRSDIAAFRDIICQSEYVKRWVEILWARDAKVVNPPIDVPQQEPDWPAKEQMILSVGRFFATGHSKRHDFMVQAFRELCDDGLRGWELHLAGAVHRDPGNVGYFERIQELARGYPVHLHPDAPYDCVQELYRRASLYWHAAGYGVDPTEDPINLEHFGMTTAEAMGHGAVPVVIGRGGQPEVVREGVDGYLWEEPAALKARTLELVAEPQLREHMGRRAREASQRFSRPEFKRRMVEAVSPIIADLER